MATIYQAVGTSPKQWRLVEETKLVEVCCLAASVVLPRVCQWTEVPTEVSTARPPVCIAQQGKHEVKV